MKVIINLVIFAELAVILSTYYIYCLLCLVDHLRNQIVRKCIWVWYLYKMSIWYNGKICLHFSKQQNI